MTLTVLAAAPAHAESLTEFYTTPVPNVAQLSNGHIIRTSPADLGLAELALKPEQIIYKTTNTHGVRPWCPVSS